MTESHRTEQPGQSFETEFRDRGLWSRRLTEMGFQLLNTEKEDGGETIVVTGFRRNDGTTIEITIKKGEQYKPTTAPDQL